MGVSDNEYIPKTKISVIIPARNEDKNIGKCIDAIAAQTYPAGLMEIIVVDDHSADKTKETAEKALSRIKINSKVISTPENVQGKKGAITEAVQNSSGDLLVITDADCQSGNKWLSAIECEYQKTGAYMLYGPVQIVAETGFIGCFQSLELCGLSLLSGAGIKAGVPLLCSGANMAYTRKLFEDIGGFQGIDNTPTGDDILLMFKAYKKYPGKIDYIKSKDAIVSTLAQKSFKDFMSQRIRWTSKGLKSGNSINSAVSMLVFSSNFFSVAAIIFSIIYMKLFPVLVFAIIAKSIADLLLLIFGTDFFNKKKLLWLFPFAEIFTMLYISWVGIAANFTSYNWKGRHYKRAV